MKNPSTISSGESDERAVSVTEWIRNNYQDHTTVDSLCDALDRTLAALATQPAESKACASVGVEPVRPDTEFLCQIWGEDIDHTLTAIVPDWDGVRRFCVDNYTGSETHTAYDGSLTLETLKREFDEHEADERGGAYTEEWEIGGISIERVCNLTPAALASPAPSVGEPVADPLQGAADWLKSGLVDVTVADIQSRLLIGYNRARRLFDGATPPAAPAATEAPSEQEEKLWGEFLADLEQIRPIGKRHAGMLKAVKKYRLLGEG